ncbi:protein decapping 5-like [Malania oleifera]|uniref:protein decapping 5-like n=1 Tax=Malania oleifera TaxID=397392 RepID=UPI0025AEB637|nr:protein decapping 5-like [Malania oleifera]
MANERSFANKASPSSSSSTVDSYIGSFVSLISKYEIRYEGLLYYLNPQDSTLGLKSVRSYGTEGRKKDGPQIPANDKVYEYILFRGNDIKDLQVKSSPPAQTDEQMHNDPAIIQSHYAGRSSLSSASVGGATSIESSQDITALTTGACNESLSSYQSKTTHIGSWGHSPAAQTASVSSFSPPMDWQGYNDAASSVSHSSHLPKPIQPTSMPSFPSKVQNQLLASEIEVSSPRCLTNALEHVIPVPLLTAYGSEYPKILPTPEQFSTSPSDTSSSLPIKTPLPSHSESMTANKRIMSSLSSSCRDINTVEPSVIGGAFSGPIFVHPIQSLPSSSPLVGSTLGPLLTKPPTLLTPDQLMLPRPPVLTPMPKTYNDQKDKGTLILTPSSSLSSITVPALQEPLLPLPDSVQQSQDSTEFTKEFDFEAMNEKFKKDEVWGCLGHTKQRERSKGVENSATGQSSVAEDGHGLVPRFDPKSAYNKDDFFDTISCNSLARGARNGQNRFSERMRQDTETFGNFQQRPRVGYGGYGTGRGENYRGSFNWGRGHGYYRGGRGGNMDVYRARYNCLDKCFSLVGNPASNGH